MPTKDKLESALRNAHAAGDAEAAKRIANALKTGNYYEQPVQNNEQVSIGGALAGGFERGVKQTLGGATQKIAQYRLNQLNEKITAMDAAMQSGEIPLNDSTIADFEALNDRAVRLAQDLKGFESLESQQRQDYSGLVEQRPIAATIGNIAGQAASIPVPAARLALPGQIIKGGLEGAAVGAIQPTVGDESSLSNAKTGAAFGAAAPAVLRPVTQAAGAVYRGITGSATNQAKQAIDFATQNKLPLMTSDISPPATFAGRTAQALGEKIPVVGTGGARAEQQAARTQAVKDIAEQYGPASDKEIFDSLVRKSDKIANAAGKRYKQIAEQMAGVEVMPSSTIATIDKKIAELNRPGSIKNPTLVDKLQGVRNDITSGPQDISLLRDNRTKFREKIKEGNLGTTATEQRIIDSVYDAMTNDVMGAVEARLGKVKADSMRQVDRVWAREKNEIENTRLKDIFNKGEIIPEKAKDAIFNSPPSVQKLIFSGLDQLGRQNARAAIIQRAIDKSEGSPDKFLNEMKRLRAQTSSFFRGQEGRDLNGLINYLDYTKEAGKAAVTTKSGQELFQLGAPVAVMSDFAATGGVGTSAFAGYGLLARAYESPAVRNILARMQGVEKGSTEFEKLAAKLEAQLNQVAAVSPQAVEE